MSHNSSGVINVPAGYPPMIQMLQIIPSQTVFAPQIQAAPMVVFA